MYSEEELNYIILSSFDNLTYTMRRRIIADGFAFPDFVKNDESLIKTVPRGVYNKVKAKFFSPSYRSEVLSALEKRGVVCVTKVSPDYPMLLKHIPEPPHVLYCKGNVGLLGGRCFSVVGSRRTPPQTLKLCRKLSGELTQQFTVVTGMADGADTEAIEGALPSGKIISVLANGFDNIYPSVNKQLSERVAEKGLMITEYPPHIPSAAYRFPIRNRIIAGLSEGILIVSAGKKSGALISADYAADYSRDVFAVPHSVGVAGGEGCNALIKKGAFLAENILDIFSVYGLDFKKSVKKITLTADESALLEAIKSSDEAFIPVIADKLGKAAFQLIPLLTSLEMKGLIVRLGGNRYSAVR